MSASKPRTLVPPVDRAPALRRLLDALRRARVAGLLAGGVPRALLGTEGYQVRAAGTKKAWVVLDSFRARLILIDVPRPASLALRRQSAAANAFAGGAGYPPKLSTVLPALIARQLRIQKQRRAAEPRIGRSR